ncbi:MAG: TolC family protein [Pleurocapsa sp. MO_226.B13]|nr:TolC family protein [Pleurocapsa sp. MO_226.B13]
MNHTIKAIQTVAISVPIILSSEASTQAEDLSNTDIEQKGDRLLELQSKTARNSQHKPTRNVARAKAKAKNESRSVVAQSSTKSAKKISYAAENLNPSANPLELPSKSSEVKIEIDRPISLQQAVELAIKNNRELQEFRLNLERSQQGLQAAKATFYPRLGTSINFAEAGSQAFVEAEDVSETEGVSLPEGEELDTSSTNFGGGVTLTYNLYTGGRRGASIQLAEKQVSSSQLQLEAATLQTRFEAVRDYYNLQGADSQVEIEQAAVDEAQQTLQDARLLRQAGIGTKFDVIRAEVELANARQRLATVSAEQSTARRQLAETLSVGQQVELKTADEIEPAGTWQLSLEESIVTAYKNRSELEELLVQREINQEQKQIALAAVRPQVDLVAAYNLNDNLSDDVNLTDDYSVSAQLNWDLFDGGAARAEAKQSETDVAINETQFANQRNEIRLAVEEGYFSLAANQGNITTSRKALELAQESLDLARVRFQSGVGTQTDVIEAQSQLTTAKSNYLRAIIDFNQSLNQLEREVANSQVVSSNTNSQESMANDH